MGRRAARGTAGRLGVKGTRWTRLRRRVLRGLRPARLRDTWIHRVIGERLFERRLWVPDRQSLAAGLALGTFIAITPTIGVHFILAAICAYALRVNIPAAVVAQWLCNPLTIPVMFPLMHRLGLFLGGHPDPEAVTGLPDWMQSFIDHGQALWIGCLVTGVLAAAIVYVVAFTSWRWIGRVSPFHRRTESLLGRERAREKASRLVIVPDIDIDIDIDEPAPDPPRRQTG